MKSDLYKLTTILYKEVKNEQKIATHSIIKSSLSLSTHIKYINQDALNIMISTHNLEMTLNISFRDKSTYIATDFTNFTQQTSSLCKFTRKPQRKATIASKHK